MTPFGRCSSTLDPKPHDNSSEGQIWKGEHMPDPTAQSLPDPVTKAGYVLDFEDTFDGDALDPTKWLPHYLPHWSSREAAAARYTVGGGELRLRIEPDQKPWCPEFDG